ncbi:MAG: DUF4783 domain-containing protein [Bacteroidales bacterium]|nr:DUF4783 domain-containing protein [Bacteroidales bacterium]
MKNLHKILALTFWLISFSLTAQNIPESVNQCFSKGEASLISTNLASKVKITIPGTDAEIDRSAVVQKLNTFFSSNRPKSYTIQHKSEKGNSGFSIATLSTIRNNYRVHVYFKLENNIYVIHQIRIEKLNE